MWTGSLINNMIGNSKSAVPEVGMGVTELCWTDRHAWEVVAVKDERHITIRRYDAIRIDKNHMSDSQEYVFASNPDNRTTELFLDKNGNWRERIGRRYTKARFAVGYASEYFDYSF